MARSGGEVFALRAARASTMRARIAIALGRLAP
jgi:hypothetical protein